MTTTRKCRECGAPMVAETRDHHFVESGLDNVWLENVTVNVCSNGHELVAIQAMAKLHRTLALALISTGDRLGPAEVKYLRKYLGLSNEDFAHIIGVTASQASRWASGAADMGPSAERLLRLLVLQGPKPDSYPVDYVAYLRGLTFDHRIRRIQLRRGRDDWQPNVVEAA